MFAELLTTLLAIDPMTADLIWTVTVCSLVLAAGGLTLAMLPWTDQEIARVDNSFRALATLRGTDTRRIVTRRS